MHIYWLFIYSTVAKKQMTPEKHVHLLPCSYFTPYKNKALPTIVSARPLKIGDGSEEEEKEEEKEEEEKEDDLSLVLREIPLVAPHVVAVSELVLSHRQKTRVLLLEVSSPPPHYYRHDTLSFYTKFHPPTAYVRTNWCAEVGLFVPQNTHWRRKIKINLGHNIMVTTRVCMEKILEFIFLHLGC